MTRDLIAIGRQLGFESLNVDLIYGLPYQTAESFQHTIDQVLTLGPDRVAMFSYAHVPWLKKQQGSFQAHLPEGKEKFRIFRAGLERFLGAGYLYIGMDHFARPGDELRHGRNRTAHCTATSRAIPPRPAPTSTEWASARSARSAKPTRRTAKRCRRYQDTVTSRGIATMAAIASRTTMLIRRPVIGRLPLPHRDPQARGGARIFDFLRRVFAAELDRLEEPRAEGLVELASGRNSRHAAGRSSFARGHGV